VAKLYRWTNSSAARSRFRRFQFDRRSGSLPMRDGGIPRRATIDLEIDEHLLEFSAVGLDALPSTYPL
jgi:hypothetical protein